jgi:hypothetical protein
MIDLVRFGLGLTLPDHDRYMSISDNIRYGDNFFQRTSAWCSPLVGHEAVGNPEIRNWDKTDSVGGGHPNHLDMPYLEDVQGGIAFDAAWRYVTALGLESVLYET